MPLFLFIVLSWLSFTPLLLPAYPADISTEYSRISHLALCGFQIRVLGPIQTEEILFVGGELPDLCKDFGSVSISVCALIMQQVWTEYKKECIWHRGQESVVGETKTWRYARKEMCRQVWYVSVSLSDDQISHKFVLCRVIYLQVSMNEGLSYITSSVHITTTECVSTSCVYSSHYHNDMTILPPGMLPF